MTTVTTMSDLDFVAAALERQRQRAFDAGQLPKSGSFSGQLGKGRKSRKDAAATKGDALDEYGREVVEIDEDVQCEVTQWRPRPGFALSRSGTKPNRYDPKRLGDVLAGVSYSGGWEKKLTVASIAAKWPQIVGENVAEHCPVESFTDEVLVIRADSTAWMNQMRILLPAVEKRIRDELGSEAVKQVRILGPTAPSWKRGRWSVPGRGPRDTYG